VWGIDKGVFSEEKELKYRLFKINFSATTPT
jgi:hypothetical protein